MTLVFGIPLGVLLGQLLLGLINGAFYALLSLGLAIIFGLLRIINFAHGALYMLGAFAALLGLQHLGVNYWAALVLSPLNPWHERDWRTGVFRFRAARTWGYGTAAQLCRKRLDTLDRLGVVGTLLLIGHLADVKPVATQGPAY